MTSRNSDNPGRSVTLKEAFDIRRGEVISLVGGGGKTTLMFALARELASGDYLVITTTTTKIFEPLPSQTPRLLVQKDGEEMLRLLLADFGKYRHITLASERLASGKLNGINPELVVRLAEMRLASCIIVEADGAAHRSLKAPAPYEPVIPDSTSLVIPVVGVDVLGRPLIKKYVFRPEIVSALLGLPLGEVISAESVAILVTHQQGIAKGSPGKARIVPFINKVELSGALPSARNLAAKIMAMKHPRIDRVVLGQANSPEPVLEVVSV